MIILSRGCTLTGVNVRSTVRGYWWGHDTLEDKALREAKKREKDVIAWARPNQALEEKEEYTYAPARIRAETNLALNSSVFAKFKSGPATYQYFNKRKWEPQWLKAVLQPEEFLENLERRKYARLVSSQMFLPERLMALGPDLTAAHFLCHANCRVRFRGHQEWTELGNGKEELNIPDSFVKGWYIEAIDAASSRLVYEGFQNMRNLQHLKYLDLSYCENFDEWCMDRISGEYADTLEYLNISGCHKLNWNGLEIIWRFKNLKTLVLKDMNHVENLPLICLLLLDVLPKLKIVGAEYMDLKLLEGTDYQYLMDEDYIPRLTEGSDAEATEIPSSSLDAKENDVVTDSTAATAR